MTVLAASLVLSPRRRDGGAPSGGGHGVAVPSHLSKEQRCLISIWQSSAIPTISSTMPVLLRHLRAHEEVAVHVASHPLHVLAVWNAMISLIRCWRRRISRARISMSAAVPSKPPSRLVDHDRRVRQREALVLGAAAEQHRAHEAAMPDAGRRDVRLDQLHRVVDRQARRSRSRRAVDVHRDVLVRVLAGQEQELRDDQVRDLIVDAGVPRKTIRSLSSSEKMS